jgi:hypothetical protein
MPDYSEHTDEQLDGLNQDFYARRAALKEEHREVRQEQLRRAHMDKLRRRAESAQRELERAQQEAQEAGAV